MMKKKPLLYSREYAGPGQPLSLLRGTCRARPVAAMPEQVQVLTSLLLAGARVATFSGPGVPSQYVRVGGRTFLRIHFVAAKQALKMTAAARRGMADQGLGGGAVHTSLRTLLAGALRKWRGIRPWGRK